MPPFELDADLLIPDHQAGEVPPRRLLILDDDLRVAETLRSMAEHIGIPARAETRVDRFFAAIADWQPTHVALDLHMPEADGIEVMGRLSALTPAPKIIVASGAEPRILEAAHRSARLHGLAVLGVLAKPFSLAELRALLVAGEPISAAPVADGEDDQLTVGELRAALDADQIVMALQPIISCATRQLTGFEALARWQTADGQLVPPSAFIGVAEQSGLIVDITDRMVDQALSWMSAAGRGRDLRTAINFSARSLEHPKAADLLIEKCLSRGVSPQRVTLEITETMAASENLAVLDCLTRLRLKGFSLSIDDFGAGYSSLVQLARLPFSELKIDREFVAAIPTSDQAKTIVRAMVGLAQGLGLSTVAEGVEDLETMAFLEQVGCERAQGYLIGKPMMPDDAVFWMEG